MHDSLLDKVISANHAERGSNFIPQKTLEQLFRALSDREREVLMRRFGLTGKKSETLEQIGTSLDVTRERVRQIERGATEKVRTSSEFNDAIAAAEHTFARHLDSVGGATTREDLLERVRGAIDSRESTAAILSFLLHELLHDRFQYCRKDPVLEDVFAHRTYPLEDVKKPILALEALFERSQEPMDVNTLHPKIQAHDAHATLSRQELMTLLTIARNIAQNPFGEFGLAHWPAIRPKRMTDKIYLVLKHHRKPLHFTEIADRINAVQFDQKIAHAPTVHNELIMDKRYILVGRGIYALATWGFKPGLVADVIESVMRDAGGPLTRDAIVDRVLRERLVGKTTIHLALANNGRFTKLPDGLYIVTPAENQ